MKTVVQVTSFRSSLFLFRFFLSPPQHVKCICVGFSFLVSHSQKKKDWLMKVPHFWLMGTSVNWEDEYFIELSFSTVRTFVWFLMHQSHKMSLFKGEEKTFNYEIAGKLHWHIDLNTKIHYKQKQTTCNIKPFRHRMSYGHSWVM